MKPITEEEIATDVEWMPKEELGQNNNIASSSTQETSSSTSNNLNNNNEGGTEMDMDNNENNGGGNGDENGGAQDNGEEAGDEAGDDDNNNNGTRSPPKIVRTNRKREYKRYKWTLSGSSKVADKIGLDDFCKEVAKVTNGPDTKWHQTNNNAFSMDPIVDIDEDFPTEQAELENFFYITGLDKGKKGNYRIRMDVETTERPIEIKKRMQQYLTRRNMFISDPEIEISTWNIDGKSNLMEMNENRRKQYDELEEGFKEITVEVSIGPITGSKSHIRVQKAVLLKCKSAHYNIVSNIVSTMAEKNYLGETYKIVPKRTKSKTPKSFDKIL